MSSLAAELMACPKLTRARPGPHVVLRLHELGCTPREIARRLEMALADVERALGIKPHNRRDV